MPWSFCLSIHTMDEQEVCRREVRDSRTLTTLRSHLRLACLRGGHWQEDGTAAISTLITLDLVV